MCSFTLRHTPRKSDLTRARRANLGGTYGLHDSTEDCCESSSERLPRLICVSIILRRIYWCWLHGSTNIPTVFKVPIGAPKHADYGDDFSTCSLKRAPISYIRPGTKCYVLPPFWNHRTKCSAGTAKSSRSDKSKYYKTLLRKCLFVNVCKVIFF